MRTRQKEGSEAENTLGKKLSHLPARFGGPGLLSFTDVAPLAYKAAAAQSGKHLSNIFGLDLPDEAPTPSQRELCSSTWEHQQTTILEGLNDPARKRLIENSSKIGKRWLNVFPTSSRFDYRTKRLQLVSTIAHWSDPQWQSAPFAVPTLDSAMTSSVDPETPGLNDATTQSTGSSTMGCRASKGQWSRSSPEPLRGRGETT
ncbi:hypothetical protein D1P53_000798 [Cryptococcus gattii VGV]|nr:hypothetical protein D1P53_000798 [Cryptococcus gattii VGV]